MPIVDCKICGKEFYTKPFWLKRGFGKYCSPRCQHEARKNGKIIICFICGKGVYKSRKSLNNSKSGKYFCSKSCQTKWRNSVFIGPKHANWKDGKFAYRTVLLREGIPPICKVCGTEDKRVLAVHHLDKNRGNNNPKNLIWLCHNCHFLVHHYDIEREKLVGRLVG